MVVPTWIARLGGLKADAWILTSIVAGGHPEPGTGVAPEGKMLAGRRKCPNERVVRSLGLDSKWLRRVCPAPFLHLPAQHRSQASQQSRSRGLVLPVCLLSSLQS